MTERPERLGISELERRLGFDRRTIRRWCDKGIFPRPHYIAGRRRWWVHDVEAWESEYLAAI